MKFFAKLTIFDLNQVDKTIYKVDKTIFIHKSLVFALFIL